MRFLAVLLAGLACAVQADEAPLRPSAHLLFKQPEMLRTGQCVRYEEGGAGWVMTEPVYFLKGEVLAAEVRTRQVGKCPPMPGKPLNQYSRDEFNRHGCTRAVGRPIPGGNAFSAPVCDHDGEPAAVLTLLGHQDHVPSAWTSPMALAVKRAAGEVSARLGWRA